MKDKLRIIVGGFIGLYPTGGVTWDYLQYPLGLKLLGHDVYYIEDTIQYSRFQTENTSWEDASYSISYLKDIMERFGFRDRWAYRDIASGQCFGLSPDKITQLCDTADVFINISASTFLREEYLKIPVRVLIDSDPMFTQIEYYNERYVKDITDEYKMKFIVENHTHHFTFGENIEREDCKIPTFGFKWIPTRQPVCLDFWDNKKDLPKRDIFTTVMNWSVKQDLVYDNSTWGQKNTEIEKFKKIPGLFRQADFNMMITGITDQKKKELEEFGWKISDPLKHVTDAESYRSFIYASSGEFSVAKETYVKSKSGWFSCRSACYLAAGRPVITQDTGWSGFIPSGEGLFAFDNIETAFQALIKVKGNIKKQSIAARQIAEEYFDSRKVLIKMIDQLQSTAFKEVTTNIYA